MCCSSRPIGIAVWLALAWCAAAQSPVKLAVGDSHGVWLKADGSVWTWGTNSSGQLGIDDDHAWPPVRVPGLTGVRDIAAGSAFTLAVNGDGTVSKWGLGAAPKPVPVAGLSGVIAVAAAGEHELALKSDGTVWAWGDDHLTRALAAPTLVPGLSGVVAIAASGRHSVAVKSDGTVWVWGDHGAGDLGNGNYGNAWLPLQAPGFWDMTAVAAGSELTVGLKKDGTVWTLGYGVAGGLGNGTEQNSNKAVMVSGLAGVKAIAAGYMHALALQSDGTVWSWGANHFNQLGNASLKAEQYDKPIRTDTLSSAVAIAAYAGHSAAVTTAGVVWAWGQNDNGSLGADDSLDSSDVPMRVGAAIPGECRALFVCETTHGKTIRICGDQDESNLEKWTNIQYRFGPEHGPPELIFPEDPSGKPALYYSHVETKGDYVVSVRFVNGAYTYRVYSGSNSGAGVAVSDAKGKAVSSVACGERPELYSDYLRASLPCDPLNPHGAAACKENPFVVK